MVLTPIVAMSQSEEESFFDYIPTQQELRLDSAYFARWSELPKIFDPDDEDGFRRLTEQDYREVAAELGIEVAAIKAVVDIETGKKRQGFWKNGKAIINFDSAIYRAYAPKHGVNLAEARKSHPIIFQRPNIKKYGSQQAAQYARLEAAMEIDRASALESCFWGMFQLGGFNWKLCGCKSVDEFCELINKSERDQLELFAAFCKARNLVRFIDKKDWAGFSLRYNGPGYKKYKYDTRMASLYEKYRKQGY